MQRCCYSKVLYVPVSQCTDGRIIKFSPHINSYHRQSICCGCLKGCSWKSLRKNVEPLIENCSNRNNTKAINLNNFHSGSDSMHHNIQELIKSARVMVSYLANKLHIYEQLLCRWQKSLFQKMNKKKIHEHFD